MLTGVFSVAAKYAGRPWKFGHFGQTLSDRAQEMCTYP